jgi:hypothetical protein
MATDADELIDKATEYGTWADWLGVPRHTFSAMFGAVIAHEHLREAAKVPFVTGWSVQIDVDQERGQAT